MPLRAHILDVPLHIPEGGESLHRGLYNALRAAMLEGRLPAGSRLPSTPARPSTGRRAPALSRWGRSLGRAGESTGTPRPFRAHFPALDAFPTELWAQAVARRARHDERMLLSDGD